jgi:hypothetical protein
MSPTVFWASLFAVAMAVVWMQIAIIQFACR